MLRPLAKVYIAALLLAAIVVIIPGVRAAFDLSSQQLALVAAFAGLMSLAAYFDLDFGYKQKMTLDTAVIFAAALLFEPGDAALIIGIGGLLSQLFRRDRLVEIVFNIAQTMLQAAAGSAVLGLVGWQRDPLRFDQPEQVALIPVAAGAIYLVNSAAVALMVALQTRLAFWDVWRQSMQFSVVEDLSQFFLGLLAAAMVDAHAWSLPLFLLPAAAVYSSLKRQVRLRQQTIDAVEALADVIDLRDPYTANHSRRVAVYARELAIELDLSPDTVELVERAARVHDIGKMVVDQVVLTKEAQLSDEEWAQLRQHPEIGAKVLSRFPEFSLATRWVRHHHESPDGSGYPDGLAGEAIPLGARIIAVADTFDAMASARPYRPAMPEDVVLAELRRKRGTQLDARVVDVLLGLIDAGRLAMPGARGPQLIDRHGVPVPLPSAM
jgi:HD-GYP domain-containing protein (c-di-GMP phosphodiesterase class II)